MKQGQTLIAIDECFMTDTKKTLTLGQEYMIIELRKFDFCVTDDSRLNHWFDLRKEHHAYWRKFFKTKRSPKNVR